MSDADEIVARAVRALHNRALRSAMRSEHAVAVAYEEAADAALRRLRRMRKPTARQVMEIVNSELAASLDARVATVSKGVQEGARIGVEVDRVTFETVFRQPLPRGTITPELLASRLASARIRGRTSFRQIPLSTRIRTVDALTVRAMRAELERTIRAGEGVRAAAESIAQLDNLDVVLPKRIQAALELAREGDLDELAERARGLRALARKRATPELRAAAMDLAKAAESARPQSVERAVNVWIREKARYQARLIARTETVSAYHDGYVAATRGRAWVHGYRWELSPSHRKADVCDIYANQDLYGLGRGGYPKETVPSLAHPADRCTLNPIIDDRHFARLRAREMGIPEPPRQWESGRRQTGAEWLATQPEERRLEILGPTRAKVFETSPGAVLTPKGDIKRVRDIQRKRSRRSARA